MCYNYFVPMILHCIYLFSSINNVQVFGRNLLSRDIDFLKIIIKKNASRMLNYWILQNRNTIVFIRYSFFFLTRNVFISTKKDNLFVLVSVDYIRTCNVTQRLLVPHATHPYRLSSRPALFTADRTSRVVSNVVEEPPICTYFWSMFPYFAIIVRIIIQKFH